MRLLQEHDRRAKAKDLSKFYPDEGDLRRANYPKHMAFFEAGREHRERCLMGGNRSGKTIAGSYETAIHHTGLYPHWWNGWRIDRPPRSYVAGKTTETTRDIVQVALFGPSDSFGSGMVPKRLIGDVKTRPNTNGAFDFVNVKHEQSGVWGQINFKTYEQGRQAFEGTERDWIWGDEEMPADIYSECLTRTGTTDGRIILTFTPLDGVTEVVREFMQKAALRV